MSTEPPHEAEERPRRERGAVHRRFHANPALSLTTKLIVTSLGTLVLVAGIIMMVTPGPGIVGIALGLAILSTEYEWADRWLVKAREKAHQARLRAEAMDPKVRRRRVLLTGLAVLAVAAAVVAYVVAYDWPGFAVGGWNWVQGLAGWVPELPGM
ncbi:MAG TPA: PGPGW domain-containing protein [Nocardioidaceae bacterium]|nr:PGPGW domain-containing protein [Nocardioidaceae bacterium]